MKTIPDFIVFTSLNEDEDAPKQSCIIAMDTQNGLTEFADYLEKNSMLSVYSIKRLKRFFFTVGTFFDCGVLEVHLKEDIESTDYRITCEQVAIAETFSFLQRSAHKKE